MAGKYAMGVMGPIPQQSLGVTLPHEHLLVDMTIRYSSGDTPDDVGENRDPVDRWKLLKDPAAYRVNLRTSDVEETVRELSFYKDAGGETIVDLSPHGLACDVENLRELSERSGLNIIASTGLYVEGSYPAWAESATVEELAERFVADLTSPADGIRRGAIGEIGIEAASEPEVRVVRASAQAQAQTGAPCFWHVMSGILPSSRDQVKSLIDVYEREGGDPRSLVLCHQDASGDDPNYQRDILERGVWIAIDNFGFETPFAFGAGYLQGPTDTERIQTLAGLLDEGWGKQILISQDICYRMMRRSWGGWGFAHILDALIPRFEAEGISRETVDMLMRANPGRLLAYLSDQSS